MRLKHSNVIGRIRQKYARLSGAMDKRLRRQWAATEAMELGWGGVRAVAAATGLDRHTILAGTRELTLPRSAPKLRATAPEKPSRTGRKPLIETDPGLWKALESLIEPEARGHAPWPLRWTCYSTAKLAAELRRLYHPVSDRTVAALLQSSGYVLLDNHKCNEGSSLYERGAQFAFLNGRAAAFHVDAAPVIRIETKKEAFSGKRKKQRKMSSARRPAARNQRSTAALDRDAAHFAARSIGRWWVEMGARLYPKAAKLLVIADIGGSNQARNEVWKAALQSLANQLGFALEVSHFPPGTTKWKNIKHSLYNHVRQDWRGHDPVGCEATVHLIDRVAGPRELHGASLLELEKAALPPSRFRDRWNYELRPSI